MVVSAVSFYKASVLGSYIFVYSISSWKSLIATILKVKTPSLSPIG